MCVTLKPAIMNRTSAMTYAIINGSDRRSTHITAYRNTVSNRAPGANCMLLHFPGNDIKLVDGPQHTRHFMRDVMRGLPDILPKDVSRGGSGAGSRVEAYGDDYTVVLAEHLDDVQAALSEVPDEHRPEWDDRLRSMINWFGESFSDYAFALACFDGDVEPAYPITVQYFPHNDDVLFVPGLEAHDGNLPVIGANVERDFRVAYGVEGVNLASPVYYEDEVSPSYAPRTVSGFVMEGTARNGDFVVPLLDLEEGLTGRDLVLDLVA